MKFPLQLSFVTIVVLLIASVGSNAQTVANDNFFVVENSQHIDVASNDQNAAGQMVVFQPQYTSAGVQTCPHCVFISVPSTPAYYGFDSFVYRYMLPFPQPPSNYATVSLLVIVPDDHQNAGRSCPIVGQPVNVTNGNMWLEQSDYSLPGIGEIIDVNRFYNSIVQSSGLFGYGWSTQYDESIQLFGDKMIRYNQPDGRAAYFGRLQTTIPYTSFSPDVRAEVTANVNGTFTLSHKDGRSRTFSSTGKLLSLRDINGNETELTYNGSGHLTAVTDPAGRTLTVTPNTNGTVSQISDSMGVIADYEYNTSPSTLKTVTYPDGSKYKFEYTTAGGKTVLATVKDGLDNVLETHAYDLQGRATTSEKHGGVEKYTLSYTVDSLNQPLTVVTDALGKVTKYTHTRIYGTNLVTKSEGVCGCGSGGSETTTYTYDTSNSWLNLKEKTDALGRKTLYSYDAAGNVTQTEEKSGTTSLGIQKWTYNARGQVLTYKDRVHNSPDVLVDETASLSIPFSYTGALTVGGPASNLSYVSTSVANPRSVTYFDSAGFSALDLYYIWHSLVGDSGFAIAKSSDNSTWSNVTSTAAGSTSLGGGWTRQRLQASGLAGAKYIRITWQNNNATFPWSLGLDKVDLTTLKSYTTATNTYDTDGNLLTVTDALNNTTTLTYSTLGQLETITNPLSKTTTLTYDADGQLIQITDADNKNTDFDYDARGRLTSTTNALNETTSFEYDLNNRLKKTTYPDTNFVQNTYDLAGRRTQLLDARGNTTTFAYDNAYRLTSVTDPLTHATTFAYDLMSNRTSQTDALGNVTDFEYDDFHRLKKVIYPPATTGATRLFETVTYDKLGNVKTRVNTNGKTTSYNYDDLNRLISTTDAISAVTQFGYNTGFQMTKVKDAVDQEYIFTYDPLGRVLSQSRAGKTMRFQYDAAGNRTKRTDYLGRETNYTYDDLNRLSTILHGTTLDSTYSYDDLSRLETATNGAGTVSFTYDDRGRLASETDVYGRVLEYEYDENGNRTQLKLDTAVHSEYGYDAANRLTTLTDDASQDITFGYDIADRLISKSLPNGITTTYEYDGMSRLKRLKDVNGSGTLFDRQYSYNAANQISQIAELSGTRNFTYDSIDRLTNVNSGAESYSYNAVGNRTASHLSNTYTHLSFNRLTATQTASYSYDANGNMTTKTEGGNSWTYAWDHENRMTSAALSGGSTATYVYDALGRRVRRYKTGGVEDTKFTYDGQDALLDDNAGTLTKYLNGEGIDNKLRSKTGSTVNYFLADHLGSTNGFADGTGNVSSSSNYDSFGNPSNTSFPNRYQFTGREYDSFSGLQFSRARWYDPKIGRFISEDPVGFNGGDINLYGYVRNQPQWYRDPTGLMPGEDVMRDPNAWRAGAAAVAVVGAYAPPVAVAVVGAGAIYGAWKLGDYVARHPSNPLSKPWVSPDIIRPPVSRPYCEPIRRPLPWTIPLPRAIPFERSEPVPRPTPDEDDERCLPQFEADNAICKSLPDPGQRARCYASATDRYGSCLARRPFMPPLVTW